MPDLEFPPFSSPDASRDCVIDLANALETLEVLVGAITVESSDDTIVTAQASINTVVLTSDRNHAIPIGKGIVLRIQTKLEVEENHYLILKWTGNSGSAGKYKVIIPIQHAITE